MTPQQARRQRRVRAILWALRYRFKVATPSELRQYLAEHKRIRVTVGTVQNDLRTLYDEAVVVKARHPTAGHTYGNGRWIAYTGWSIEED